MKKISQCTKIQELVCIREIYNLTIYPNNEYLRIRKHVTKTWPQKVTLNSRQRGKDYGLLQQKGFLCLFVYLFTDTLSNIPDK